LDIENEAALREYLRANQKIGPRETPLVQVLHGGVSNRTILLQRAAGRAWVLKQALRKLRVEADWFSDPIRIQVEAEALRYLPRITPPGSTPRLVFEDRQHHLLAMEAVPQPHENWKQQLLSGKVELAAARKFAELLSMIHAGSYEQREDFAERFRDLSFFETLRLEPYYLYSASVVPEATTFLTDLVEATRKVRLTLVHGDYSPKNILIYRGNFVLLDQEVVHFGDPAFDVGFSLTHLLSKALYLKSCRESLLTLAEKYWKVYRKLINRFSWSRDVSRRAAKHTLACLLARTSGRSQLEYLSSVQREQQRQAALELIKNNPQDVSEVIERFGQLIAH
jgi:5-methylthioribose kinase